MKLYRTGTKRDTPANYSSLVLAHQGWPPEEFRFHAPKICSCPACMNPERGAGPIRVGNELPHDDREVAAVRPATWDCSN